MSQMVDVVVGGQYGSEAKGHVTAQLVKTVLRTMASEEAPEIRLINVRVAGPNAGHTVYDEAGNKFAFRTIPVGAVIDDRVDLYIAPGSEVDLVVLYNEIDLAERYGHSLEGRLFVSRQATVIEQEHKDRETELIGAVGSTGKGIGAARAARLMRHAETLGQYVEAEGHPVLWTWAEPEELYAHDDLVHDSNQHIIIEGTQGYGLSLRASGHYPQVTSSDARAVDFLAMAGIDPTRCSVKIQTWVVCRVFPIRVAGNSGPMQGETTWAELGLPEEKTTVTQKVRRVGQWDQDLVARAVQANGGHQAKVVITMLDQVIPGLADVDLAELQGEAEGIQADQNPALEAAVEWIEEHASYRRIGAPVAAFTFGPTKILFTGAAFPAETNPLEALIGEAMGAIFGTDD